MRITINDLKEMKAKKEKIVMITAYDYSTARLVDDSGIPLILVGDSLGMVMLGYETTIPVTMEEMIHHTRAVSKGVKKALVVGDMPFMSYHSSISEAMKNAARFLQDGGCQALKLEGGEVIAETIKRIVNCGIPVMGHLGLTPQAIYQLGGFKAQGKTRETAAQLLKDARALEEAGAFAIVLETVPAELARLISEKINIPTIGIGAGPYCDGQVQVIHDLLGLYSDFVPKHAKQYARLAPLINSALTSYLEEVRKGIFPSPEHSPHMNEDIIKDID